MKSKGIKEGEREVSKGRRKAKGSYERISFGLCVDVSRLVLPWQSIWVCVCTCMHVCMSACMHHSAAAKQKLLYIKAGSWLCPEVSVISLSVTHTLCRHTSTQACVNPEL